MTRPRIAILAAGPIRRVLEKAWPELSVRLAADYPDHEVYLAQPQPDDPPLDRLMVAPVKGVVQEGAMTELPKVNRDVLADVGRELEVWWAGRK